jgi:acylaminoacyl-peptidase
MMERVSDPRLSPDGRTVLYAVRSTDWEGNRGVNALWVVDVEDGTPRRLPISEGGAASGRWSADGTAIYFLSSRGGSSQVWRADADGVSAVQLTRLPVEVVAFRVSPDGKSLILSAPVFVDCDTLQCTRDRMESEARTPETVAGYDRMPLRQFDRWNDGRRQHLLLQPLNGSGLADGPPTFPLNRKGPRTPLWCRRTDVPSSIRRRRRGPARPSPTTRTCSGSR